MNDEYICLCRLLIFSYRKIIVIGIGRDEATPDFSQVSHLALYHY